MFQFAGFASPTYVFSGRYRRSGGLPHSEIHGSKPARGSPWLIATCCVLHRLSVPRHPPDALHTLVPYLRMRHAQEKAHRGQTPARPHPAKMHRHDPTSSLPLRGDGPVGSSSVTHSLHMSKIPYPPQRISAFSLTDISLPGHYWSPKVTIRHLYPPPGGGGRDRTDDLMLAKHALSQLSYAPTGKDQVEQWWAREDLNFRPHAYQARALTN